MILSSSLLRISFIRAFGVTRQMTLHARSVSSLARGRDVSTHDSCHSWGSTWLVPPPHLRSSLAQARARRESREFSGVGSCPRSSRREREREADPCSAQRGSFEFPTTTPDSSPPCECESSVLIRHSTVRSSMERYPGPSRLLTCFAHSPNISYVGPSLVELELLTSVCRTLRQLGGIVGGQGCYQPSRPRGANHSCGLSPSLANRARLAPA